jgi:Ca2+-binding RTX toxin-like protein
VPNTPVTWRDEITVNATTASNQSDPDVTQLANGNILVSWTTGDPDGLGSPNGTETFAQIFDPLGNPVGNEIRLNFASTTGDEQNADLAPTADGGFIVAYHDLDNPPTSPAGGSNLRLEEYDSSGTLLTSNPLVVLDSGAGSDPNYRNPRVAVSSATSALIVYEEFTASGTKIAGKIYNPATDTYGSQLTLINASGVIDGVPDVAMLSNGNYVIATAYRSGTDNAINYTIITNAGGGVKSPTFVTGTNTDAEDDREVSLAALAGGGFVISWTNTDSNDTDVQFRVYNNAGTEIGSGNAGDDSPTNENNESKVIALADGTYVIAWDNDTTFGVNVQRYDAAGERLGLAFVVSADNANNISGVGLSDGRFALIWDEAVAEISMEILDTRDVPNTSGVYAPDPWQVGTNLNDTFTLDAATRNAGGGLGSDSITGNSTANALYGDDGNDTMRGRDGADVLDGGAGADEMRGGADNDKYYVDSSLDLVFEAVGKGADKVFASVSYTLGAGQQIETLRPVDTAATAAIDLTGNELGQKIVGSAGVNRLVGAGGNDQLNGGAEADILRGGSGNDRLWGGLGQDQQRGGSGNDVFVFKAADESPMGARDTIDDFDDSGEDRMDLSHVAIGVLTYRGNGAFTGDGQVRIHDIAGPDVLVKVNLSGSLTPELTILLTNTTAASMSAGDFIL